MRSVFEASTGVEAHMILNLLQQEGIDGRVDGEYLQGGVGELQAINVVRVVVQDADYEKAKLIISEWESNQPDANGDAIPAQKRLGAGFGFLLGLLFGVGGMYWAYNSPVTIRGVDYNGDGRMDETWVYKDNRLARTEIDRNRDGKVDLVHKYDWKGMPYKAEVDDDFDGVYETNYKYLRGNIYAQESDLNQDGKLDYRASFSNGVLDEIEILDPDTGVPRKRQKYTMNKLSSAEYDADGDGIYDVRYEYDYYEEIRTKSNNQPESDAQKQRSP